MGDQSDAIVHAPWAEAPPDFAIGLRPIAPEAWLEGGEAEPWRRKDPLLAAHRDQVWAETPASRPGQAEILSPGDRRRPSRSKRGTTCRRCSPPPAPSPTTSA